VTRVALIAALAALAVCPAAAAHGGGGASRGYSSTITSIAPPDPALHIRVLDADDRLELWVDGDRIVIVRGYENEPYLRFSPDGVYRNTRSPATYLNDDRFGNVRLPTNVDPAAPPEWHRVAAGGQAYDWHDHRIHWMSPSYPPAVAADTSRPHHVFDWVVTGTIDGRPLHVRGSLDYSPPRGQPTWLYVVVAVAAFLLAGGAITWLRMRRATLRGARR
jgi:hypothetical protein